jgi:hypothetical protein
MASEWHYTQNGQPAGTPVSSAELKRLAASGQLLPTDMVWREGMANWVTAGSIKDLFPAGSRAAEPAPRERVATSRSRRDRDEEDEDTGRAGPSPGLNPFLVLLLTVCTGGIFGLFYSIGICRSYAALAAKRQTDAAGRPLGKARHPLWVLLMTYLTLGYYFYYWVYVVMRECSAYTGRQDFNHRTEFALMLINPLYAIYVAVFRLPDLIKRTQATAGIPESSAIGHTHVFLNPCMFCGLPFLAMLYQDALNQVWFTAP